MECGYPIVSQSLQWGLGLYVTGALAELEMLPISRHISGARQAAERIVNSYRFFIQDLKKGEYKWRKNPRL
ncbi:hypothetical protein BKC07_23530 [Peribacillus simplex]|nr:hypothetical protein BKC07_23530 [Peribacillus simplex]